MEELNDEELKGTEGGACLRNSDLVEKVMARGDLLILRVRPGVKRMVIGGAWTASNRCVTPRDTNISVGQTLDFDPRGVNTGMRYITCRYSASELKIHRFDRTIGQAS